MLFKQKIFLVYDYCILFWSHLMLVQIMVGYTNNPEINRQNVVLVWSPVFLIQQIYDHSRKATNFKFFYLLQCILSCRLFTVSMPIIEAVWLNAISTSQPNYWRNRNIYSFTCWHRTVLSLDEKRGCLSWKIWKLSKAIYMFQILTHTILRLVSTKRSYIL